MNRAVWQQRLTQSECPPWPCPTCGLGVVVLYDGSMRSMETATSAKSHMLPDWEPEWIDYLFTAQGKCTHPKCNELFALAGMGGVSGYFDSEEGPTFSDYFTPLFCSPMPDVIKIPTGCPDEVRSALRHAFALVWISPSACAGRLRVALEAVMDSLGIPRTKIDKKGRSRPVSLHGRIKALASAEPEVSDQLIGVKWLGNAGSHNNDVDMESLLDGLEVLEYALAELMDRPRAKVSRLAKELSSRWGGEF